MSLDFSKDFLFGCATASYQVEGASFEDGRKPCIWDTFAAIPGKVFCGDDGKVSVDQYHRYKEDIELMDSLGIQAYRFSIAWPRIIPNGRGEVNPKGIEYYRNLCKELHKHGMKAMIQIPEIPVKAHSSTELKPGSYHIMLFKLNQAIDENTKANLTLTFDNNQSLEVRDIGSKKL